MDIFRAPMINQYSRDLSRAVKFYSDLSFSETFRTHGRIYGPGGAAEQLGLRPTTLASKSVALDIPRHKKRSQ